jgi:hypothetical protein
MQVIGFAVFCVREFGRVGGAVQSPFPYWESCFFYWAMHHLGNTHSPVAADIVTDED